MPKSFNGGLFTGGAEVPRFSRTARSYLIHIGSLDWTKINPDIFGSMIQAVADDAERGALGMHYTSVPNILKVLNPLFLDDLRAKLAEAAENSRKLLNLREPQRRGRDIRLCESAILWSKGMKFTEVAFTMDNTPLSAILANNMLWFSPKATVRILDVTKQAVSIMAGDLARNHLSSGVALFTTAQKEGKRRVQRSVKHYSLTFLYSMALASRKADRMAHIISLAQHHGIEVSFAYVPTRKERQFRELLEGVLCGVTAVKHQHKVGRYALDFFIPELNLAVEYDERPHLKTTSMLNDARDETRLKTLPECSFFECKRGRSSRNKRHCKTPLVTPTPNLARRLNNRLNFGAAFTSLLMPFDVSCIQATDFKWH